MSQKQISFEDSAKILRAVKRLDEIKNGELAYIFSFSIFKRMNYILLKTRNGRLCVWNFLGKPLGFPVRFSHGKIRSLRDRHHPVRLNVRASRARLNN